MHKLGIIIPYRNRVHHLRSFTPKLIEVLEKQKINYEIIVVEQSQNTPFNRGKLLNIGFVRAKELKCDYVAFHDIDMLPVKVDYSWTDKPIQLANAFYDEKSFSRTVSQDYFGGVTLFPVKDFEKINGYSNKYIGWGFEDDDLFLRAKTFNLPTNTREYNQYGKHGTAVEFNGKSSLVKFNNVFNFSRPLSIYTTCKVYDISPDENAMHDEFCVYAIPGYDMNFSYNSYKTYKFEIFSSNMTPYSINTNNLPPLTLKSIVTIDPKLKQIKLYINGKLIGIKNYEEKLDSYKDKKFAFLGVADPKRVDSAKYFKGNISEFAVYDKLLNKEEIKSLFNNSNRSLLQKFDNYDASDDLKVYFDGSFTNTNRLIDLSGNDNHGFLYQTKLVNTYKPGIFKHSVPYRRLGKFKLLSHDETGYKDGYWVDWNSRLNQIRFYSTNKKSYNPQEEGLNTLEYNLLSEFNKKKYHYLVVEV